MDRSLKNLATDTIDLLQIHCPPTDAFYHPEVFELFDDLVKAGKIRFYGVSVERVEEGLKALDYPGVQSVQMVYNMFRQRPRDLFLAEARRRKVGVLARLPLSSGMLAGKMTRASKFAEDDHRSYNREGEHWDKGETFSGVPFEAGLAAVEDLRKLVPEGDQDGDVRAALDPDARGGDVRDPGRQAARPGGRQLRRRRSARAVRRDDGGRATPSTRSGSRSTSTGTGDERVVSAGADPDLGQQPAGAPRSRSGCARVARPSRA